jgi:hypothetical protein
MWYPEIGGSVELDRHNIPQSRLLALNLLQDLGWQLEQLIAVLGIVIAVRRET